MKHVLKNRNFMTLLTAQLIEQFADSLSLMSLISWAMSQSSEGSASAAMSALMFFIGLPIVIIGPFAGVLVDRINKKWVMAIAPAIRAFIIIFIAFIINEPSLRLIFYGMVFLISVESQFFIPAKSALIPEITDEKDLLDANSLSATAGVIVQILTYAVAGAVIAETGYANSLLATAVIYFAVALCALFIKSAHKRHGLEKRLTDVMTELKEGVLYMIKNKKVMFVTRRVLILMGCVGFFYIALAGGFINELLGKGGINMQAIKAIGFVQAFLGIGLIMGIFAVKNAVKWLNEERLIRLLFPMLGMLVTALFFIRDFYFLIFTAVACGMAGSMVISVSETLIQKNTESGIRGRIFSSYYIIRGAGLAAATSITGFIAKITGESIIVLVTGMFLFVFGALSFWGSHGRGKI